MIVDLETPTEEAVKEAIEYFKQRGGLTTTKKPARDLWDDGDWMMFYVGREIFHANDDRIRRDRYKDK